MSSGLAFGGELFGSIDGLLAKIPSPSSGVLKLGPLSIHAYGLMIAFGIVAGVWLAGKRLTASGAGNTDDMSSVSIWGVVGGVIGARLYHVITDWDSFSNDLAKIPKIWQGGLGIPGGIALGAAAGLYQAHRRGLSIGLTATAAAPAIPLAQAIGRLGNYFNQELFGRPTTLPWGLEVSADKTLAAGYPVGTLFHPTFLYEMLWNLALVGVLLLIDRRITLKPGSLMGLYLAGYGLGRFWVEGLRIDAAHHFGGMRLNQWVALAIIVIGAGLFVALQRRPVSAIAQAAAARVAAGPGVETTDDADLADVPAVTDADVDAVESAIDDALARRESESVEQESVELESVELESVELEQLEPEQLESPNAGDAEKSVGDEVEHESGTTDR